MIIFSSSNYTDDDHDDYHDDDVNMDIYTVYVWNTVVILHITTQYYEQSITMQSMKTSNDYSYYYC